MRRRQFRLLLVTCNMVITVPSLRKWGIHLPDCLTGATTGPPHVSVGQSAQGSPRVNGGKRARQIEEAAKRKAAPHQLGLEGGKQDTRKKAEFVDALRGQKNGARCMT